MPPHERALAIALAGGGDDEARRRALAGVTDAEAVRHTAEREEVLPLLAYRVERLGLLDIGAWQPLRHQLLIAMAVARAEADWRRHCVSHVLDALRSAGIDAVPIKGIWLAERYYPAPWCRRMDDADLVVAGEPRTILDVLAAQGIGPKCDDPAILDHACSEGDEITVYAPWPGATAIDLHFRLYPDMPLDAAAEIIARATPDVCLGVEILAPSPADHLIVIAHHLILGTLECPWRRWLDVDLVARAVADWDTVISRSIAWGNPAILLVALAGAHQRFDTPIPDSTWDALTGALTPGERPVVATALAHGAWQIDRDALLVSQWRERGVGWRSHSIARLLWPHPGFVARRLKAPSTAPHFWFKRLGFAAGRFTRAARAVVLGKR
jgi:hypothetical protein